MTMPAQQPASALLPSRDFPENYGEMRAWFPDDASCMDFLEWLRWPEGFVCPKCGGGGSRLADGRSWCESCHRRVSVTAGTVFHRTHTPLTVWFAAAWYMTCAKNGVAALTLHRLLGFGSYQTAWAMLHRLRGAMVRHGRDRLVGEVEVDETFFGGVRPGKRGRGAAGKVIVVVAVEVRKPTGYGRCRLGIVPNAKSSSLDSFLRDSIESGSTVITDGLKSYPPAIGSDYVHRPVVVRRSGVQANALLPGVHRISSLAKRWLLGTHQGAVEGDHLQAYLDEFAFRFNRRKSEFRGLLFRRLLEQCVQVSPISYKSLVVNPVPKSHPPLPPGGSRAKAKSLAAPSSPSVYPWRTKPSTDRNDPRN